MNNNSILNINAIIQARMGSSRLPGKILLDLSGKPMLKHVVERLGHSKFINKIIIATSDLPEDDRTVKFCLENEILFSRGSSGDVLSRYYETAKKYPSDLIIRITADCPVIDAEIIDNMLEFFIEKSKNSRIDYLSNVHPRTFPRGLDTEIFTFSALEIISKRASQDHEREHVTPYFYQHPEIFAIGNFANGNDYSFHRWTVDTKEDYELIREIYSELYNPNETFHFEDIIKLFERRPELFP